MIGLLNLLGAAQGAVASLGFLVLLVALIALGLLVLRRARRPARLAWLTAGLAVAAALALTLWPDSGRAAAGCSVGFSWTAPSDVQSLANIALLLPATFFATIASRRPVTAAAAGAGLSATIEVTQALLPALSRACTTQDWQMNTIGAVLGAAIGWWTTRIATRAGTRATSSGNSPSRRAISSIWTGTAIAAIVTWIALSTLNPVPSDPCDERPAGTTTVLPGRVAIHAGSQSGHLCIEGPDGNRAGLSEDPPIGTLQTYGTGPGQWSIGVARPETLTATDARGTTTRTQPVQGSKLRVWSTWQQSDHSPRSNS